MIISIEAVYEDGVLKPVQPLPLQEHDKVQVTLQTPVSVQSALAAVQRSYGLLRWTGDLQTVERVALDPEFGIREAP